MAQVSAGQQLAEQFLAEVPAVLGEHVFYGEGRVVGHYGVALVVLGLHVGIVTGFLFLGLGLAV